jgi:hypothetical protein
MNLASRVKKAGLKLAPPPIRPKPKAWKDRKFLDIQSGWQFRTFKIALKTWFYFAFDYQDGCGRPYMRISIALFQRGLSFETPIRYKGRHMVWYRYPKPGTYTK